MTSSIKIIIGSFKRISAAFSVLLLTAVMLASVLSAGYAGELPVHGFLQGNYTLNTKTSNPDGGDFKWAEERVQLKFDSSKEPYRFFFKGDAFYDHLGEKGEVELREGYADYTAASWDLRAGRQIITWGYGDLVFINDVFPKDYEAFFSGRPLEYLKKGVDGVKAGIYPGFASIEAVIIPFFEPNKFPNPNRFFIFDPMSDVTNRVRKKPASTLKDTEAAVRVYRDIGGYEAAIYFYRGFFRTPSLLPGNSSPARLTIFYPEINDYGASLQGRFLDGVISIEAGYYESRQDRKGTDPFIPNSSVRFLAGYQRQLLEDFTVGLQYYGEYMSEYSRYLKNLPASFPAARKLRDLASIRLTQLLRYQTLKLSFFAFYSPADKDYLMNPEVNYKFSDNIWASLGMNIFGGVNPSQFGSLDKDDNVYLQIRREF